MKNLVVTLLIGSLMISCGSKYDETMVKGTYGGEAWEAVSITCEKTTNLSGDPIFAFSFTNVSPNGDPCTTSFEGNVFHTTCPQIVDEHEFGIFKVRFGTFYVDGTNILSNNGAIEILEINEDAGEVKARIWCENDENNKISGTFTAKLCSSGVVESEDSTTPAETE